MKCGAGEGRGKIRWTDRVKNEEVLLGVKEERNIVHTMYVNCSVNTLMKGR